MITDYKKIQPKIGKKVFIAPDAWVIGDVELADNCSVFFGSVLRGDILPIRVGKGSNIQEHSMLHTTRKRIPCEVGEDVTVGHRATLHGCVIRDRVLIGMGAIVLDEAVIEDECLVGAGSVVTENKKFPPRSLILGAPAKAVRTLDDIEIAGIVDNAENYVKVGAEYLKKFS